MSFSYFCVSYVLAVIFPLGDQPKTFHLFLVTGFFEGIVKLTFSFWVFLERDDPRPDGPSCGAG